MTDYPSSIYSASALADDMDYPQAAHINTLRNEIAAIETALGVNFGASPVSGDILYYNGTSWTRIAKGTAGQRLAMNSGATAPEWVTDVITQNSQSAAYTTVLSDGGKHILHPTADNNARTFTIDSNANVAYPIGTAITFVNQINTVTIAITSDTMTLASAGTTGSRTLAANGIATALKIASTSWIISGTGLT